MPLKSFLVIIGIWVDIERKGICQKCDQKWTLNEGIK